MSARCPLQLLAFFLLGVVLLVEGESTPDFRDWCAPSGKCTQPPACECLYGNITTLSVLQTLPPYTPHDYWKLFDVSYNSLTIIQSFTFQSAAFCETLEDLYLENNHIATIEVNAFAALTHLKSLSLKNNPLRYVSSLALNISSLEILSLENCSLSNLEAGSFAYLNNLKTLNLNKNNITTITPDLFKHLTQIKEIHLGENSIKNLANETFNGLAFLETVNLRNNKIRYFHQGLFRSLPRLKSINVESNRLKFIEMHTIHELADNLNGSRLFHSYDLFFANNSWDCADCLLIQVFRYCYNISRLGDKCELHITCATPASYQNMTWEEVNVDRQLAVSECKPFSKAISTAETTTFTIESAVSGRETEVTEQTTQDNDTLTDESSRTVTKLPNCALSNMNSSFDLTLCSLKTAPTSDEDSVELEAMCVYQYYFLGSYAIFVFIVACTVSIIIYRVKLSEMLDEDLYF